MSVIFHSPPNWPVPPVGFLPPAGWKPQPAWGPAPQGWVFYTNDGTPIPAPASLWQPPAVSQRPSSAPTLPGYPTPATNPMPVPTGAPSPAHSYGVPAGPQSTGAPLPPPFGPGGATPPARKNRVGLFVGIGAGALALIVTFAVVVFVMFSPSNGPTLNFAQFSTLFSTGDTVADYELSFQRSTAFPLSPSSNAGSCEQAVTSLVTGQGEQRMFAASDEVTLLLAATRFSTVTAAQGAYDEVKDNCTNTWTTGVINGARWFSFGDSSPETIFLQHGNVTVFAGMREPAQSSDSDVAKAIQGKIAEASKR